MKTVTVLILAMTTAFSSMINLGESDKSWYALNDGVMGGLSKGNVTYSNEALVFTGNLSFENNGGFASIRSPYDEWDLSQFESVEIKYRSTGQDFGFVLEKDRSFWMPTYRYYLPQSEEWNVLTMPLKDFEAHRLGEKMGYSLPEDERAKLIRLGIITTEKTTDAFRLEIDYITFK